MIGHTVFGTKVISALLVFPVAIRVFWTMTLFESICARCFPDVADSVSMCAPLSATTPCRNHQDCKRFHKLSKRKTGAMSKFKVHNVQHTYMHKNENQTIEFRHSFSCLWMKDSVVLTSSLTCCCCDSLACRRCQVQLHLKAAYLQSSFSRSSFSYICSTDFSLQPLFPFSWLTFKKIIRGSLSLKAKPNLGFPRKTELIDIFKMTYQ